MGNFGFSYMGLIFLLALTIPNLIWTRHQPKGYDPKSENRALLAFERTGQVLVTTAALVFSDYNLSAFSLWSLWLFAAISLMVMYELWWLRYFKSQKKLSDFYSSFCRIPVSGATLPVAAFFLLGIYGKVIWLIFSVIILGIGHIGIHLQHSKHSL